MPAFLAVAADFDMASKLFDFPSVNKIIMFTTSGRSPFSALNMFATAKSMARSAQEREKQIVLAESTHFVD